ncbi:3-hydroxyacyl-ACP dehydratase [Dyadobacter sp.]|uniref:3-hydroxyacyl-ACP dehydratase n=1 Tax=Dyadobacter sp. TaxID=1914288 RepID=UPI003F6F7CB1
MQQGIYQIGKLEQTEDSVKAAVKIDPSHALFNGHFPGAPVVPGVIQLEMVQELLAQHTGRKLKLKSLRTCKFLEVLDPSRHEELTVFIKYKTQDMLDITASGESGGSVFFKLQATFI